MSSSRPSPSDLLGTPRTSSGNGVGRYEDSERGDRGRLEAQIDALMPTPTANLGTNGGSQHPDKRRSGNHSVSIQDVLEHELLPTPTVGNGTGGNQRRGGARSGELLLPGVLETLLPTPTAADSEGSGGSAPMHVTLTDAVERTQLGTRPNPRHEVKLLPTPAASLMNDGEDAEQWQARHDRHAAKPEGATRSGMPLPVAVQDVNWGKYAAAVQRAAAVIGRAAPEPTKPDGKGGRRRMSSLLVEWMMLLPEAWVTGRGLSRSQELVRLGNGVVPLAAAAATCTNLRALLEMRRAS